MVDFGPQHRQRGRQRHEPPPILAFGPEPEPDRSPLEAMAEALDLLQWIVEVLLLGAFAAGVLLGWCLRAWWGGI